MTPSEVRDLWRRGEHAYGMWVALGDPFAVELTASAGLHYICLDQQHGIVDYRDLVNSLPVIEKYGALPITRVPELSAVPKALDAGAMGVVIPMVSTAQEARSAVAACRYAPHGIRSFGPIRAALAAGSSDPSILGDVLCIVMVETVEGLENLDQIASTPGVDAIYVGPADLGLSLGLPAGLEPTDPTHVKAIASIREACESAGIVAGIQCSDGAATKARADEGFQMLTFGKDTAFLKDAVSRELRTAQGKQADQGEVVYT